MKCPYCGADMEKGKLRGRGGNFFLPDGKRAPLLYSQCLMDQQDAIMLPPSIFSFVPDYPTTYACRACKKLIVSYD